MLYVVQSLFFFITAANAVNMFTSSHAACTCSSGFIPIPVDIEIPVDPSNPTGLNSTDTIRLQTTFEVYGELCEPVSTDSKFSHAVQLLLHGQSYTSQYWDVNWNGFQNYSYVALSCTKGISSFAYDNTGAGRTTRPISTDCQLPTASNVSSSLARELKSGMVSLTLTGRRNKYEKVVGFGHSIGSTTLNYAAIGAGRDSPFDGLVLTGFIHDQGYLVNNPVSTAAASEVDPGRFPNLDPGYVTNPNGSARSVFYGPTASSFSPAIFQLDELTKDAGPKWIAMQASFVYTSAFGFTAPVVELVASFDQLHCISNGKPCDQTELQASEAIFFPDSKNFTLIVIEGFGHDLNLEFGAAKTFSIMNQIFENFVI